MSDDAAARTTPDTRERIIAAAAAELAKSGFAGARMDAIARAAGCNKQSIYYYFASKAELASVVLERFAEESVPGWSSAEDGDLTTVSRLAVSRSVGFPESRRLLAWEGFEYGAGGRREIVHSESRSEAWRLLVELVEARQADAQVDDEFDPRMVALLLVIAGMSPFMLPQLTRMITGLEADDPAFVSAWERSLAAVARHLAPR